MTTADHTPSRACYLRGCRTEACVRVADRYRKRLRLEHSRGQYRLRDATQVRTHIQRLMYANWTQRQIAEASGIPSANIHKIHVGAQTTIANWRAAAILNVRIGPPTVNGARVDATGSQRRLQALRVLGHRRYDLADQLDITADRIKHITTGATRYVSPEEAAAIARLYRRLSTTPGPSQQTATLAKKLGWHGPMAWDDIDDPNCQPETEGRTDYRRRRKAVVDHELVARRTAQGRTAEQIAAEIGCHKRSVVRARGRVAELEQAAKAGLEAAA